MRFRKRRPMRNRSRSKRRNFKRRRGGNGAGRLRVGIRM